LRPCLFCGDVRPVSDKESPRGNAMMPAAVVLAGCIVAAAVYFGLAKRKTDAPVPPPTVAPTVSASAPAGSFEYPNQPPPPPAPSIVPPTPPATPPASSAVERELQLKNLAREAFITSDIPKMNEKCWLPALEKLQGAARQAAYDLSVTFDAKGKEIKRTIEEKAIITAHPELTKCLKELEVPKLTIAPQGKEDTVSFQYYF